MIITELLILLRFFFWIMESEISFGSGNTFTFDHINQTIKNIRE